MLMKVCVVNVDVICKLWVVVDYSLGFLVVLLLNEHHHVMDIEKAEAFIDSQHFYHKEKELPISFHCYKLKRQKAQ